MGLTSLISTLEAYQNAETGKFISNIIPELTDRSMIMEHKAGPETVAGLIMSGFDLDDVLEYNEIVDLKMIIIVICRGFNIEDYDEKEYTSLNAMYELAYTS